MQMHAYTAAFLAALDKLLTTLRELAASYIRHAETFAFSNTLHRALKLRNVHIESPVVFREGFKMAAASTDKLPRTTGVGHGTLHGHQNLVHNASAALKKTPCIKHLQILTWRSSNPACWRAS